MHDAVPPPRRATFAAVCSVTPPAWARADLCALVALVSALVLTPLCLRTQSTYESYEAMLDQASDQSWSVRPEPPPTGYTGPRLILNAQVRSGLGWAEATKLNFYCNVRTWNGRNLPVMNLSNPQLVDLWRGQILRVGGPDSRVGVLALLSAAGRGDAHTMVGLPMRIVTLAIGWAPAVLLPLAAAVGAARALRRRTLRRRIDMAEEGRCPACGYTVEGIDRGAPCPECGRSPREIRRSALIELGELAPALAPSPAPAPPPLPQYHRP